MADDEALADDAVADADGLYVRPDLDHRAGPLVAGDDREADPPRVGEDAGHHLDVGPAQAGLAAADEDVADSDGRLLHLPIADLVGPLDDDRLHGEAILRAVSVQPLVVSASIATVIARMSATSSPWATSTP